MTNKKILKQDNKYEFTINNYNFIIEYMNLPNSTASGIIKIYKQNHYISLFCSVIIKENKEEGDFLNLNVNFNKCTGANKLNNDEILISRAIDKSIRPLLNNCGCSIAINIAVLQSQNWIDMKFASIFTSIAMIRKIFNINVGVSSVTIAKEPIYFGKYDRFSHSSYLICTSSDTAINFLELESNKMSNLNEVLNNLLNYNKQIANELSKISSMRNVVYTYDEKHIQYLDKRFEKRKNLEHRRFDIQTNLSNNSLVLSRGDTTILNTIYTKSGEFEFDHIYKSSGFASNEIQNKSSRREIGHGDLIHKALYSTIQENHILKKHTTKLISYVLNANGSTSMASVMAGALNLLKEGFITSNELIYGISFGVFMHQNNYNIICDMTAKEDNLSAMDFKIVQDAFNNIYAIQMDCRWPITTSIILKTLEIANDKFKEIANEIKELIDKKQLQHNLKKVISLNLSNYLKKNPIIMISFKRILTHLYFDNKLYLHLQSNKINLNSIANFYLKEQLIEEEIVIIVLTTDINNETDLKNELHNYKFTRKQTFKCGEIIECIVKSNNKISFIKTLI